MDDIDAKLDERLRILKEARKDQEETLRLIRESLPALEESRKYLDDLLKEREQKIATLTIPEDRRIELELQIMQTAALTGIFQVVALSAYVHRITHS